MIHAHSCAQMPNQIPSRYCRPKSLSRPEPEPQAPTLDDFGPPPYAYGYIHVSWRDEKNSAEVQREKIEERVKRGLNGQTFTECLVPDGASGENVPFAERHVGQWLLRVLNPGDAIVVAHWDRLGRYVADTLQAAEMLYRRQVSIYLATQDGFPVDLESPEGHFLAVILMESAQFENKVRARRIKQTFAYRRKRGLRYTQWNPMGMKTEAVEQPDGSGKKMMWVPDPV